jgi:outer membrane protein assembly factor BamB
MSAGSALLPTIIAALTSLVAILLKPRELAALCRRRPIPAAIVSSAILLVIAATTLAFRSARLARPAPTANAAHVDWARVAEDLLAQQRAGREFTRLEPAPNAPTPVADHPVATAPAQPAILSQDITRCSYDGSPAPEHLARLWSFRPDDTMFLSRPFVAGNRIYVAGCQADLGGYTGLLACLDADTGRPLWQVTQIGEDFLKPFFSSPSLTQDGKYLIIGQGLHEDRNCSLLCFDASTGQFRWAAKTTLHIESSPAIRGDIAVAGAGAIEDKNGKAVGNPGFLLAVRISDGTELWRHPVNDPESSPAIDDDNITYIGSGLNGNAIIAVRTASEDALRQNKERLVWRTPVSQPVIGGITLAGDLVIAGAGNGDFVHSSQNARGLVVALDRKTGQLRWQTPLDDAVLGDVAFRDGILICPCRTGEVLALSATDGSILWHTRISGNAPVLAGPAFTGQRIYAAAADGTLALLDAKSGKILERLYLNDPARPGTGLGGCPPQIARGHLIVGSETGGIQCFAGTGGVQ